MKIRLENTRSKITERSAEEHVWLDDFLSFREAVFRKGRFGVTRTEQLTSMFNKKNDTFPSGLLPQIKKAAHECGVELHIDDGRVPICDYDLGANLEWLYDYQFEAVQAVAKTQRGILHLTTGAGKTDIFCGLCKAFPCHWLFVVHRADLMHQAAERWKKRGGHEPGICGDSTWAPDPKRRLTVATFQTLSRGLSNKDKKVLDLLRDAEALCVDENHTCAANEFNKVAMETRRAYYRVGLSGTPLDRSDKRAIYTIGALGPVIYRVKPKQLIDLGILAQPKIKAVKLTQQHKSEGWQAAYKHLVAQSHVRNVLIVELAKKAAKPSFVFVKNVDHGKLLTKALRESGIKTEFVWGQKATSTRAQAIKDLRYGNLDVIVCSVIFQEGIDVPELKSVINAAGMKSTIAALQRIGRGMRSDGGKKADFEVWEVFDRGNKHIQAHALARMRAYKKEGHTVEIVLAETIRSIQKTNIKLNS
jgi:superfamily II DNA or RNA helicase